MQHRGAKRDRAEDAIGMISRTGAGTDVPRRKLPNEPDGSRSSPAAIPKGILSGALGNGNYQII